MTETTTADMSLGELLDLGISLHRERRVDDAIAIFQAAIGAHPTVADAYVQLGGMLYVEGFITEAAAVFEIGLELVPQSPRLHWLACMATLPRVFTDQEAVQAARDAFAARLRSLRGVCTVSLSALIESADAVGWMSPFFLPYQGQDDMALQSEYGRLALDIMVANFPQFSVPRRVPWRAGEKIRVGFVSGLFVRHAVWRMPTRGWIDTLDRGRFEIFGYHLRHERDDQTAYAEQVCDRFRQGDAPVATLARQILADAPHVLIYPELGNVQRGTQLACLRLAPVQCTTWGQPVTSGIATMDYYLSSDLMEPPDADRFYTERLVRLPNLGIVYRPEYTCWNDPLPETDLWAEAGVPADAIRIACAQALPKYLPAFDDMFPRIAQALPAARFLFVGVTTRDRDILVERLWAAFARFGLSAADHCTVVDGQPLARFSSLIRDAHIFLDTPLWSGCNTTFDALGHGTPVVTLAGSTMRARHGYAILTLAGVPDTVVHTVQDMIAMTVRLGQDPALRASIGARLRQGASRVYEDTTAVRALEDFLTQAVADATG